MTAFTLTVKVGTTDAGTIDFRQPITVGAAVVTGSPGPHGPAGSTGPQGDPGEGVAVGGTTGQVLTKASDADFDTEWTDETGGGGAVSSVNGQTGDVVLAAADVGADAAGAAAAAQAASQPLDADLSAIAAESTTAFGRGLLTAADAAALRSAASLGDVATHAASDFDAAGTAAAAVASEASTRAAADTAEASARATADTAEATARASADSTEAAARVAGDVLALQKASDLSDLHSATTARTNLGLGTASTHPTSDFDAAGAATTAQANAEAYTDVETARAEAAEAALIPLSQKGAASGVATLDSGGKVPTSQLPALAITDTSVVISEAAMLALTAQRGDVAIRTDFTPRIAFILTTDDPTQVANWQALDPATTVTSVNGGTGAVTITAAGLGALVATNNLSDLVSAATARTNLGLGTAAVLDVPATGDAASGQVVKGSDSRLSDSRPPTTHAHAESDVTSLTSDLAAKVPTSRQVASGTGLTGGGDLSADRTLAVSYGTTAGTAAQGNDSRLSDARTPTSHAATHASGGSDPVTLAESQVTGLTADLAAKLAAASNLSDLGSAATARTNLGLGTAATHATGDFDASGAAAAAQAASQPLDGELTALAGLVSAADKVPYFNGVGSAALADFTAAGRALVDDADASAQRTTLGLGTAATHPATDFAPSSGIAESAVTGLVTDLAGKLAAASNLSDVGSAATSRTNLGLGSAATHATGDFDAAGAATAAQAAAQAASTKRLTRTAVKTADYTAAAGDLVPVDTTSGAVTVTLPAAPADGSIVEVKHVTQGGTNAVTVLCAGSDHYNTTAGATSATLALLAQAVLVQYDAATAVWTVIANDAPLSQLDGRYAQRSNNLSDLVSATTARTNLGLGTAATANKVGAGSAGVLDATDATTTNARTPTAHASTHASGGSDPVTLAESQVTNLTTDLAAKAPLASPALTGTPTAPTAAVGTNTTQLATTAFVAAAGGGYGLSIFGDGSDGSPTFDGSTTILTIVPSSNVYSMKRDLYLASPTINSGITLKTNGYRLFVSGTLTNNGTIAWNGAAGSNTGSGGNGLFNGSGSITTAVVGSAGGAGGTAGGTAGAAQSNSWGAAGGKGGDATSGSGAAGGVPTAPSATRQIPRAMPLPMLPNFQSGTTQQWLGGTGGGGGAGDGTNTGGAGGDGGGIVSVIARTIAGTGAIQARGGAGGTPTLGNTGGGGGGGGGYLAVVSGSVSGGAISGQTIDANGGAKGSPHGTGTDNAAAGTAGMVVILPG